MALFPVERWRRPQLVLRRLGTNLVTLLVIAYLALFGLIMAERGREGLPAEPLSVGKRGVQHAVVGEACG